jgi:hypothetical protein
LLQACGFLGEKGTDVLYISGRSRLHRWLCGLSGLGLEAVICACCVTTISMRRFPSLQRQDL